MSETIKGLQKCRADDCTIYLPVDMPFCPDHWKLLSGGTQLHIEANIHAMAIREREVKAAERLLVEAREHYDASVKAGEEAILRACAAVGKTPEQWRISLSDPPTLPRGVVIATETLPE